jgi:hypothetical protein
MRVLRLVSSLLALCGGPLAATAHPIEKGVAITDSEAMRELEKRGFAFSALMSPDWKRGEPTRVMNNAELARIAPLAGIRDLVVKEFEAYERNYISRFPAARRNIGTGVDPDHRKFDQSFLVSSGARFELVGVVNRMDRMFRTPQTCGEVRLIYRLAYRIKVRKLRARLSDGGNRAKQNDWTFESAGEDFTQSRLPMTINLVLGAVQAPSNGNPDPAKCRDIAKRWVESGKSTLAGPALARAMIARGGVLEETSPAEIDRIETNFQVIRVPAKIMPEFGGNAEYLLHVFKWNATSRTFALARLENQIDRTLLLREPARMDAFKRWLFTAERLHELAEGTIKIPEEYLATRAITSAPGGTARATNRPFLGIVTDAEADKLYADLGAAAAQLDPDKRLRNISSGVAVQQRLTDITCTGCHQSRAIGGFHFLGADWKSTITALPQNSIFVPGSAHFYSDLPRRRAVVEAIAAGKTPDFGRGFSMRPRVTGRAGKVVFPASFDALRRGWGANCYVDPTGDASFRDWQCSPGLTCKPLHASASEKGFGICVTVARNKSELKVGDPFIFGSFKGERVAEAGAPGVFRYRDTYCPTEDVLNGRKATPGECLPTPGEASNGNVPKDQPGAYQSGGFFGGLYKASSCKPNAAAGTVCTSEAGQLFSKCVGMLDDGVTSFVPCLSLAETTRKSTVRSCNLDRPCRDDYVCLATPDTLKTGLGACLPPYFLFQFRIDGHPTPPL